MSTDWPDYSIGLAGTVGVVNGGTGQTTLTAHAVLLGNGQVGIVSAGPGAVGTVLHGQGSAADPTFSAVSLTADVTGILPLANGGTGTATPALVAGAGISLTGAWPNTTITNSDDAYFSAGVLAIAHGGTATATAFTAGSVVFAGALGVYSQNNANFFWDNTNTRLGIGTATPGVTLEVDYPGYTTGASVLGLSVNAVAPGTHSAFGLSVQGVKTVEFDCDSSGNVAFNNLIGAQGIFIGTNSPLASAVHLRATNIALEANGAGTANLYVQNGGNVGVGTSTPGARFEVLGAAGGAGTDGVRLGGATLAQPFTTLASATTYVAIDAEDATNGGFSVLGFSNGNVTALDLGGAIGTTTPTVAPIHLRVFKLSGTSTQALAASELAVDLVNSGGTGTLQLLAGGKIARYNNIATTNDGVASLLGTVDLTAQTAAILATTIITTSETGLFRVSAYILVTTAGTAGTVALNLLWTDDKQAQTLNSVISVSDTTAGNFAQATTIVRATSATAIQYSTTLSGITGSPAYSLWVRVESLG